MSQSTVASIRVRKMCVQSLERTPSLYSCAPPIRKVRATWIEEVEGEEDEGDWRDSTRSRAASKEVASATNGLPFSGLSLIEVVVKEQVVDQSIG